MTEQLFERKQSRLWKIARLSMAGALLALPLTANKANSQGTSETGPIYVSLPDWNCNPENSIGITSRETENFVRPDTSVTDSSISVTYPIEEEDKTVYQTVVYENPGLRSGEILRYYSDSRDCPLPDGASTIPSSAQ